MEHTLAILPKAFAHNAFFAVKCNHEKYTPLRNKPARGRQDNKSNFQSCRKMTTQICRQIYWRPFHLARHFFCFMDINIYIPTRKTDSLLRFYTRKCVASRKRSIYGVSFSNSKSHGWPSSSQKDRNLKLLSIASLHTLLKTHLKWCWF